MSASVLDDLQRRTVRAIVNVFESGRVLPNYAALTVLKGDSGHLSYGKSQVSLASGNLFRLLQEYCSQPHALCSAGLTPYLPRFARCDATLDTDGTVKALLVQAGKEDPVMWATQDRYFDSHFLDPACTSALGLGIRDPLGLAVVYDGWVQGHYSDLMKQARAQVPGADARALVQTYIGVRRDWLSGAKAPLPNTVYRMDTFTALIARKNWELALPLVVHGVEITEDALGGAATAAAGSRTLRLTSPYLRGDDVKALQAALQAAGLPATDDGVFGPFTAALVRQWQQAQGLVVSGVVDPATRDGLKLGS